MTFSLTLTREYPRDATLTEFTPFWRLAPNPETHGFLQIIWFDHTRGLGFAATTIELARYLHTGRSDVLNHVQIKAHALRRANIDTLKPGDLIDAIVDTTGARPKVSEILAHHDGEPLTLAFSGHIRSYSPQRGFGFVSCDQSTEQIYFSSEHVAGAPYPITAGLGVRGTARRREHGLHALTITVDSPAASFPPK